MKPAAVLMIAATVLSGGAGARAGDLAAQCAAARNDDTLRPYDPSLQSQLLDAYRRLFPDARTPPDQRMIEAETNIRCMNGHLYACFTGANLPCGKMNTASDNKGADAYCRANPDASFVPAYAVGHDSVYSYRCRSGSAEIDGRTFPDLDERGFASKLWTPLVN